MHTWYPPLDVCQKFCPLPLLSRFVLPWSLTPCDYQYHWWCFLGHQDDGLFCCFWAPAGFTPAHGDGGGQGAGSGGHLCHIRAVRFSGSDPLLWVGVGQNCWYLYGWRGSAHCFPVTLAIRVTVAGNPKSCAPPLLLLLDSLGLWTKLLRPRAWDSSLPLLVPWFHPLYLSSDENSPASWCVGHRHHCWVADILWL